MQKIENRKLKIEIVERTRFKPLISEKKERYGQDRKMQKKNNFYENVLVCQLKTEVNCKEDKIFQKRREKDLKVTKFNFKSHFFCNENDSMCFLLVFFFFPQRMFSN